MDGVASYVMAFRRVFRQPLRTGRRGRPQVGLEAGWLLGQVIKRDVKRQVASIERRVVRGTETAIAAVLATTHSGMGINTADPERLNATFHASLTPLVRRGCAIARPAASLTAGMWLVGGADNCCWRHDSLRLQAQAGACWKWQERPPAMAAGLMNQRWTMQELLCYQVPLPTWVALKRQYINPREANSRR